MALIVGEVSGGGFAPVRVDSDGHLQVDIIGASALPVAPSNVISSPSGVITVTSGATHAGAVAVPAGTRQVLVEHDALAAGTHVVTVTSDGTHYYNSRDLLAEGLPSTDTAAGSWLVMCPYGGASSTVEVTSTADQTGKAVRYHFLR